MLYFNIKSVQYLSNEIRVIRYGNIIYRVELSVYVGLTNVYAYLNDNIEHGGLRNGEYMIGAADSLLRREIVIKYDAEETLNLSLQMIGERYENTNYKWWSTQGKYVAIDGDSKRDFIQF